MPKYRYTGEAPADLPTLGRRVKPGETIDAPEEIVNPLFVPEDQPHAQPAQGQQTQGQQQAQSAQGQGQPQAQSQTTVQGQQAQAEGQPQKQ